MENADPETLGTKDFDERSMSPEYLIRQEGAEKVKSAIERIAYGIAA
jgi:hypothetical protein